ncbi:uncharacterized protein OCT59_000233 [Rhizophagus irregularis]|uniref:uncharacterized protein n=1 Tax=Rhizophagus irregularis TaxID=588596 RepID=UPI000CB4EB8D|nr:hypothetical protein OCT59_000233 [Rhizophagus irregularis]
MNTPKLKTSSIPILFIPFNSNEKKCNICGNRYSKTLKFEQKYCKNCLFQYLKYSTGNNTFLDAHITTNNIQCIKFKKNGNNFHTMNIQEWCEHCSEVSYFRQVIPNILTFNRYNLPKNCIHNNYSTKDCGLCKNMLQSFEYGPGCYQIFSGWIKSTLTKKFIPILYLPWWDNCDRCLVCPWKLKYIHQKSEISIQSDRQKWCSHCFIIYTGCSHCLTTNIIFGITDQSQCKKCTRISVINIDFKNIISGNCIIDKFLASTRIDNKYHYQIANYMNNVTNSNPLNVYKFIGNLHLEKQVIEWIPYCRIKNLRKLAEGGFSIVYQATLSGGVYMHRTNVMDIAVKKLNNSQNSSEGFLNELKSLCQLNDWSFVIKCYGITQDPVTKEYMLIMNYAKGGNLHNYLQNNFINITWNEKLHILWRISAGLNIIHYNNLIHRDIHSGNILSLYDPSFQHWLIGDLGLSQPANNTLPNDEIYGVIPYIAPEILTKSCVFSKESDIYSFGMIIWELTTGCKPFANVEHDINLIYEIIDGKRPEITNDTPECLANLMEKCWDADPSKRPTSGEILNSVEEWYYLNEWNKGYYVNGIFKSENKIMKVIVFKQAEEKRLELIQLKKLGPEFSEKSPKAIYTGSSLNSKQTTNSSPTISSSIKHEYITKEFELDININNIHQSSFTQSRSKNFSSSLSQLTSTVIANSLRKRNIEELKVDPQKNRKNIKTNS